MMIARRVVDAESQQRKARFQVMILRQTPRGSSKPLIIANPFFIFLDFFHLFRLQKMYEKYANITKRVEKHAKC